MWCEVQECNVMSVLSRPGRRDHCSQRAKPPLRPMNALQWVVGLCLAPTRQFKLTAPALWGRSAPRSVRLPGHGLDIGMKFDLSCKMPTVITCLSVM